ncbi:MULTISPECIES: FtsB family cell division protein [Paenibacillus]|uniref:Septum formation initiator family protein n=1 Tax=Paenibacillus cineris TaxID=237530 RepID=A0ABQ4LP44_9BACL|nr:MULTISPECIES: septum formation initiator family protein [Paenibacillus]OXL86631.1 hypothetical protein BCV73_28825 [Paenibacillus sp. SSG-1]UYO05625.1 septum formation initiator family protein [Paenibacillus sp. PSB04]GIO58259.1 hypothetical protein J21TS7_65770 [Paenibacillus cineris]GIO64992.1 hypothetical protein J43TS9_65660 [Paenibacillus cineris]
MGKYAASPAQTRPQTTQKNDKQPAGHHAGARRRIFLWLTFMILFMGWAGYTFIDQNSQIADKSSELSKKLKLEAQTTQTKAQLERDVKRLNDPEYIGQLARKKYGLYLPGETPIHAESTSP